MPDRLTEPAPAKVNLYLHVTGRRDDGYHLLDSLVVFAGIGDTLSAAPAETLSLHVAGPFAAGLAGEPDNLVLRAARALAAEAGVTAGAHLVLDKHLPVASGIGGGSADAAAALRLLCRLWRLAPQPAALAQAGSRAWRRRPGMPRRAAPHAWAVSASVWDRAPVLPACGIVLVNPGIQVATAEVFRARHGAWSEPAALPACWDDVAAMAADLRRIAQRPGAGRHRAAAGDRRRPGGTRGDARLSAGANERLGRHLLRPLSRCRDGCARRSAYLQKPGRWCWAGSLRRG